MTAYNICMEVPNDYHCDYEKILAATGSCTKAGSNVCVDVLDLFSENEETHTAQSQFKDAKSLSDFLARPSKAQLSSRIFFISQQNSWRPLNITSGMFTSIFQNYNVMPMMFDIVRSFKGRSTQTEDAYCSPLRMRRGETSLDICYLFKYAERSEKSCRENPWSIRQTGVYYKHDERTRQSLWIVMSPIPNSLAQQQIGEYMRSASNRRRLVANSMLLHTLLMSSYISNWRDYCEYQELELEHVGGIVATCGLASSAHISYDTLLKINVLEQHLLPLQSIFISFSTTLSGLVSVYGSMLHTTSESQHTRMLQNLESEISAHRENTKYLTAFAKGIRSQIRDTLNLRNQDIAKSQSSSIFKLAVSNANDSVAIRIITFLTLSYLPSSYIATVMGMNFFELDSTNRRVLVSRQFWIYFCISIPLTAITILIWKWKTRRSSLEQTTLGTLSDEEAKIE